jgi:hypothetical protein
MASGTEVHYDEARGELSLNCGEEDFARWLKNISSDIDMKSMIPGPVDVRTIILVKPRPARPPSKLTDRLILLGCAASIILLFVFFVGLGTIVKWWR